MILENGDSSNDSLHGVLAGVVLSELAPYDGKEDLGELNDE